MTRVYGSGTNPIPPGQRRRNSSETKEWKMYTIAMKKSGREFNKKYVNSNQELVCGTFSFQTAKQAQELFHQFISFKEFKPMEKNWTPCYKNCQISKQQSQTHTFLFAYNKLNHWVNICLRCSQFLSSPSISSIEKYGAKKYSSYWKNISKKGLVRG